MSISTTPRGGAFTARGGWSPTTTYFQDDFVVWQGNEFQSILPVNIGNQPDISSFAWIPLASGSGGGGLPAGWLDVKAYGGAKGDGVTDDTTAIQNTINQAGAAINLYGTVYFPPGNYVVAGQLSMNQRYGVTLMGAGPVMQYQTGVSRLLFTGSTGHLLTMYSTTNCEVVNLEFGYNNAAFTGDLIDIDGGPFAADCQCLDIHHCGSKNFYGGGPNARSIIRLNKVVIATIRLCHWTGAVNPIRVGDPGGSYVNVVQIEKCSFNFSTNAHILFGSADGESVTVRDCTFEAGTNTTAIRGATTAAGDSGTNQFYNPIIEGCWFGDASAPTVWIDSINAQSAAYQGTIRGNRFANSNNGTHLKLGGAWLVEGNSFEYGIAFDSGAGGALARLTSIANYFAAITSLFNYGSFPTFYTPSYYMSLNNTVSAGGIPVADVLPSGYQARGIQTNLPAPQFLGSGADLTMGAQGAAGYAPQGNDAKVYKGKYTINAIPLLACQMPVNGEFQILGGPAVSPTFNGMPNPVLRTQDQKLGLYGVPPASIPASTGSTTGYIAGTGTALTVDGKFTGGGTGLPAPANFAAGAIPAQIGAPTGFGVAVQQPAGGGSLATGTYFYQVTSFNGSGESVPSLEGQATTSAPNGSVKLTWNSVVGATGYNVYRATTSGGETSGATFIGSVPAPGGLITFIDSGIPAMTGHAPTGNTTGGSFAAGTYYFQITATNAAGESLPSVEKSATIVLNGACALTWTPVPGATGYKLYRATVSGGESTSPALVAAIGGGTTASYADKGNATSTGAIPGANTAITAYTLDDVVKAMKQIGALAS